MGKDVVNNSANNLGNVRLTALTRKQSLETHRDKKCDSKESDVVNKNGQNVEHASSVLLFEFAGKSWRLFH